MGSYLHQAFDMKEKTLNGVVTYGMKECVDIMGLCRNTVGMYLRGYWGPKEGSP
jgi:hypothetical protein